MSSPRREELDYGILAGSVDLGLEVALGELNSLASRHGDKAGGQQKHGELHLDRLIGRSVQRGFHVLELAFKVAKVLEDT